MRRFVVALVMCAAACDGPEPSREPDDRPPGQFGPGEELSYEKFDRTRELSAAEVAALGPVDAEGVFRPGAEAPPLQRGDVLVASTSALHPDGFVRMVKDASAETVTTVLAPPQAAFKNLHVKLNRAVNDYGADDTRWQDMSTRQQPLTARAKKSIDYVLFDGDGSDDTTDDQLRLKADLGGGYEYLLGIDFDWGSLTDLPEAVVDCILGDCSPEALLPELKAGFVLTGDAATDVLIEGVAYQSFEKEQKLAEILVNPPVIVIGPLVFTVNVEVKAVLSGSASSRFSVGANAAFEAGSEVSFSSDNGSTFKEPDEDHDFDVTSSSVGLSASVRAAIQSDLNVRLYGVLGPRASLGVFTELTADQTLSDSCYRVTAGATLELGIVLGVAVPGFGTVDFGEASKDWTLLDEEIASGNCTVPEGGSSLAPGAGADFETLANPTFTPVSRAHEGIIRNHPASTHALSVIQGIRTIDGHVLVGGEHFEAATKLDETGAVVWSRRFVDEDYPGHDFTEPTVMRPTAFANAVDASVVMLTEPGGLISLAQDGAVQWAQRMRLPRPSSVGGPNGNSTEARRLMSIVADGEGGFFIAGTSVPVGVPADTGPVRALLYRVDSEGTLLWSRVYTRADRHLYPVKLNVMGPVVSIVGMEFEDADNQRRIFQLRLDKDGAVLGAQNVRCAEVDDDEAAQPTATVVTSSGNLVIAGFQGALDQGLIVALQADGTPVFGARPWTSSGLSYFVPSSIIELPTSGFALAGTYTNRFDPEETFISVLDAAGAIQWLDGYQLSSQSDLPASSGNSVVFATNDGGLLSVQTSTAAPTDSDGSLWATKVFAKNGEIDFTAPATRYPMRPFENAACTPVVTAFSVTSDTIAPVVEPMSLVVDIPTISSSTLTP